MFLQAGSGIDAGSVSLAPTLNCSFFNSAIDMRNGSANRFARKVFAEKIGARPDGHAPISLSVYNCG
jgi:hypothetical protein